jgi:EAL domain-containing protein (putative c-di-GMP-specific phosphodiesterase class I)
VDDPGKGYSSLIWLQDFSLNKLKFNKHLLQDMRANGKGWHQVKVMEGLA